MFKRMTWLVILVLGLAAPAALAQECALTANGRLTDAERQELVALLERSQRELEDLVRGLDADAWSRKPAPDRWSVGQVVEHLILAEQLFFDRAGEALAGEARTGWHGPAVSTEEILAMVADRSRKFEAPASLAPSGELGRDEALAEFRAARAATLELVRTTDAPLKRYAVPNPLLEEVDLRQMLIFLAAHQLRHDLQIAEVKAALGRSEGMRTGAR